MPAGSPNSANLPSVFVMPACRVSTGAARLPRRAALLIVAIVAALASGCTATRWDDVKFDRSQLGRNPKRPLTLVYFRHWSVIDCTEFEERTLKDPRVIKAMADMTCILLDYYWDKPLADGWAVSQPPAVVILNPAGQVIERQSGLATPDAFIGKLEAAKREHAAGAAGTRPTSP